MTTSPGDAADLLALADRVEREEPSRELDCDIFCATADSPFTSYYPDCVLASIGGFAARVEITDIKHYTTSLDASETLRIEGWTNMGAQYRIIQQVWLCIIPRDANTVARGEANTEPQARTAAWLRARAAMVKA